MAVAMNGGRRITVREAQIKTATVEIKALTIGAKQVTQSVFWQVAKEDVIDGEQDGFPLRGVPWGRVNYYRAPCKEDHVHIVWQKGDELRRACVFEQGYREVEWYWGSLQGAQYGIGDLLSWRIARGELSPQMRTKPPRYHVEGEIFSHMDRRRFMGYEGDGRVYALSEWGERAWFSYVGLSGAEEEVATQERRHGTPERLEAHIAQETRDMVQAREWWAQRWTELCALDQLFIAV